ncbi:MAG: hypothetical protein ABW133_02345 [Polyangiaceae bacterium]
MRKTFAVLMGMLLSGFSAVAWGDEPQASPPEPAPAPPPAASDDLSGKTPATTPIAVDARSDVPILAFAYSAYGVAANTWGAQAFGTGLAASGQDAVAGGGGAIWGSPLERLTLIVDARRSLSREFTPSAAGIVRLYGDPRDGLSLGALGKFKVDGFSAGPDGDEVESEIEAGALVSYVQSGWQLDANAIGGMGLGDDGEADAELRLRLGRNLGSAVRVGIDGQARMRLSGERDLPNGRNWDFAAGPQVMVVSERFFGALTVGPSTTGLVTNNVGWLAMLSLGGTSF